MFPSSTEFKEWLLHPVTKEVMRMLHAERETMRQSWEGGSYTDYTKEAVVLTNVANLGVCRGLALVTDLTYAQLATKLDVELTQEEAND